MYSDVTALNPFYHINNLWLSSDGSPVWRFRLENIQVAAPHIQPALVFTVGGPKDKLQLALTVAD